MGLQMTVAKHDDCPFKGVIFDNKKVAEQDHDHKMDTRVGRLEGVVESLTRDIQEVSQNISVMGKEIGNFREMVGETLARMRDGFNEQLNIVTDRMTASTKPQWQTISAFIALAITLLGMAGAVIGLLMSGQAQNVSDLKHDTGVITERMFLNQYEKGKSDAFAAETNNHLNRLDLSLQREITLTTQSLESEVKALDEKSQTAIRNISDELKSLRLWQLEHATSGSEADARLTARQEMAIKSLNDRITRNEQVIREELDQIKRGK